LKVVQSSDRAADTLHALFDDYRFGRYCRDEFFDIHQARRLERARVLAFLAANPHSSWLVVDGEKTRGTAGIRISDWDTGFWGVRFAILDHFVAQGSELERQHICSALLRTTDAWCEQHQVEFCCTRVDAHDVTAIQALEEHGYRYIETTIENRVDLGSAATFCLPSTAHLRPPIAGEEDELAAIAQDAFPAHRFYADERFPRVKADAMYRELVLSSFRDPGCRILVLEADGALRGFVIHRLEDLTSYFGVRFARWRLAALETKSRRAGYGTMLFRAAIESARQEAGIVESGLTSRNLPSVNLHAKVGFRTTCCTVTLHRWSKRK
jgi:GNAT superfamily N-acetyltransferase